MRLRPGAVLRAIVLLGAVALTSGCVFVPVGPPIAAGPAVAVPGPVIVAPRPAYRFHRGHYGGHWRGHRAYW